MCEYPTDWQSEITEEKYVCYVNTHLQIHSKNNLTNIYFMRVWLMNVSFWVSTEGKYMQADESMSMGMHEETSLQKNMLCYEYICVAMNKGNYFSIHQLFTLLTSM